MFNIKKNVNFFGKLFSIFIHQLQQNYKQFKVKSNLIKSN